MGELRALLPFEKLWQDTWYNTSVTMKKVREAIVAAEDKAASDLEVLATVESEFAEAVKIKYLEPAANAAQAGTWEPGGGEAVEETIYLLRFECQVTRDQAAELSHWLKERNISYRRI